MNHNPSEEFIGREIEVIEALNKNIVGIKGKIIDETKNTFLILDEKKEKKRLLKKDAVFRINRKEIPGEKILRRPEERIKFKNSKT